MNDWEIEHAAEVQVTEWFEKYDYLYLEGKEVDRNFIIIHLLHNRIQGTKYEKAGVIGGADHEVIYLNHGSWTLYDEFDIKILVKNGARYDDGLLSIGV